MKQEQIVPIIIIAVVVVIAAATVIYFLANPAAWQDVAGQMDLTQPKANGLTASGFIEAEEVTIAPELGGRVLELLVDEGDEVEAGQVLVRLDGALLEAQIEAAQASLDLANAQLAQARAGARPQQIRKAEAQLAVARAGRDGAHQAWQDLVAMRDNPQELNAQIALAEAQVAVAEAALEGAVALKDVSEIAHDAYRKGKAALSDAQAEIEKLPVSMRPTLPGIPLEAHLIPNARWKAWAGVNSAGAAYDGAVAALNDLYAMRANPQELNARIDEAEAGFRAAEAAVRMAQAQLDALEAGATAEQIAMMEAQVEQAEAALDGLLVLRDKQTISAPVGGLVLERSIREGELAAPGGTLLILGDLDQVTLTVYVPEDKLGRVHIGQEVRVTVDSRPGETFVGTVVAIANEAEFTPRNVQTQEERVNMVFAVEVSIPNPAPGYPLKPGVPADAVLDGWEQ